jgi:hypothetical protein
MSRYDLQTCRHCRCKFDTNSAEKNRLGGFIDECVHCMKSLGIRDVPEYLAVKAGDGKMSDITLLRFDSDEERERYNHMWKTNTGFYKGKSCQIGRGLTSTVGFSFETVAEMRGNPNHKGKA